jgi:hypothetical protein
VLPQPEGLQVVLALLLAWLVLVPAWLQEPVLALEWLQEPVSVPAPAWPLALEWLQEPVSVPALGWLPAPVPVLVRRPAR